MGLLDSIFGGGGQEVESTQKVEPGPYPDRGEEVWDAFMDKLLGTPEQVISGGPPSDLSEQLNTLSGDIALLRQLKDADIPGVVKDSSGRIRQIVPNRSEQARQLFDQYGTSLIGMDLNKQLEELQAQEAELIKGIEEGFPRKVIPGTSGIGEKIQDQYDWLRDQHGTYTGAMRETQKPVLKAISDAYSSPINIQFGGNPIGSLMMRGGINMRDLERKERMTVPNEEWMFAQQLPKHAAAMKEFDLLRDIAGQLQGLRYGVPSQSSSQTVSQPLDILGGVGNLVEAGTGAYDLFKTITSPKSVGANVVSQGLNAVLPEIPIPGANFLTDIAAEVLF